MLAVLANAAVSGRDMAATITPQRHR
jgi:hypothetical protein